MMSVVNWVEYVTREVEALGKSLPHCYFVHKKSHILLLRLEPGPTQWDASD
jgi:hypothetical protein